MREIKSCKMAVFVEQQIIYVVTQQANTIHWGTKEICQKVLIDNHLMCLLKPYISLNWLLLYIVYAHYGLWI